MGKSKKSFENKALELKKQQVQDRDKEQKKQCIQEIAKILDVISKRAMDPFYNKKDVYSLDRLELQTLFSNICNAYQIKKNLTNKYYEKLNEKKRIENKINELSRPPRKPYFYLGGGNGAMLDLCTALMVICSIILVWHSDSVNFSISGIIAFAWNVFLGFVLGFILTFVLDWIVGSIKDIIDYRKELAKYKIDLTKDNKPEIEKLKNKVSKITKEISDIVVNIKSVTFDGVSLVDQIHEDYLNISTLQVFNDYLKRGRCGNLRECINLYIQEGNEYYRHQELMKQNERIANENERRFRELENSMSLHDYVNESKVKDLQDRVNSLNSSVSSMEWNNFWNKYK